MSSPASTEPMTAERVAWLRAVAREQRALLLCILAYVLLTVAAYAVVTQRVALSIPSQVLTIVFTLVVCASVLFGVKLAGRVFGVAGAVVYALILLSPLLATWVFHRQDLSGVLGLVSLVALLVINGRASRALKAAGIRVGLIGADPRDLR